MNRWRVQYRAGSWRIVSPRGYWHDSARSLPEAVEIATRYAIWGELDEPGGLERFSQLKDDAHWWHAYIEACEVVSR